MNVHAPSSLERYGAFRAAATAAPSLLDVHPDIIVSYDDIIADNVGTAANNRVRRGVYRFELHLNAGMLFGGDLASLVLLNAFANESTTPPKKFSVLLPERIRSLNGQAYEGSNLTKAAIGEIKALSGLTNEQIAPLLGVSRRSLQAWIAGEPISQRKQQRLLGLRTTLRTLDVGHPSATRQRLIDQTPGCVRVYDLLADGQFETAVDVATGRCRVLSPRSERSKDEGLVASMSRLEDRVEIIEAPSTGRFSGRLRR